MVTWKEIVEKDLKKFSFLDWIPIIGKKRRKRKQKIIDTTVSLLEYQEKYIKENPMDTDRIYTTSDVLETIFSNNALDDYMKAFEDVVAEGWKEKTEGKDNDNK